MVKEPGITYVNVVVVLGNGVVVLFAFLQLKLDIVGGSLSIVKPESNSDESPWLPARSKIVTI